jgi:outer membrane receptor protein involved in Fe transport
MRLRHTLSSILALWFAVAAGAQAAETGTVSGHVADKATGHPIEFAAILLKSAAGQTIQRTATDAKGVFTFEGVPLGDYRVTYSLVGGETHQSEALHLDAAHRAVSAGDLTLETDAIKLQRVEVNARKEAFYNSIDRKVYNVGKDVQSVNGSASDLLQNVPSVDVDIDGNVSLRGDGNVLILVDGRTSSMMGANRAAVLQQMPADAIQRIEVITNPSAKYKPDGTAGIINIVMKKKQDPGYSGSVRASVGNDSRYNVGVNASYNPGKYTIYGSYNLRQDDRVRTTQDTRSHLDPTSNQFLGTKLYTKDHQRPISHIGQLGADYKITDEDKVGAAVRYNHRRYVHESDERDTSLDPTGAVLLDYDRRRTGPEIEQDLEFESNYHHAFAEEGHELNLELKRSKTSELQDNAFSNVYRTPTTATTFDRISLDSHERDTEGLAEYTRPLPDDAKLEAGYDLQVNNSDFNHNGANLDLASSTWISNPQLTNYFLYDLTIHAVYGTYARPIGPLGALVGLRLEQTQVDANQLTASIRAKNDYFRAYPSLHLSYNLDDKQQLQWNYSHRVHRPENEDLNPYPNYIDPFNLRAGNPNLLPEETHSIETGYQYKDSDISYLATLYYRYSYHGFTQVTKYINSTTQLTTEENLSKSQSGGLELATSRPIGPKATINFSGNAYYNEIDASNLGYSSNRSTIAWSAKLNANYHATKADLFQLNSNYNAKRLTAQGYRLPTFVANIGWRHDLADKHTALVLTISDVFNTQKEETRINTSILQDDRIGRRTSRVIFLGVIYNFGKPTKKSKDDIQFDSGG